MSGTSREYNSWRSMHQRCTNPAYEYFHLYGGKGVKVCERWADFAAFKADMGPRPLGTTLDRKDSNGDYTPDNCRWATNEQQIRNRCTSTLIQFRGELRNMWDVADEHGISGHVVYKRLRRGVPPEEAITRPVCRNPKRKAA